MKNLTRKELELFASPLITLPMLFGLFVYGIPTAYVLGVTIIDGYREGTGFMMAWGGLVILGCLYFLWLHLRAVKNEIKQNNP